MELETKEKAVPNAVVGATEEQQISKNVTQIIPEDLDGNNTKPTETSAMMGGLEVLSMTELYDSSFEPRVPVVDGLLNSGTYIFAGAPKVGKSFFMAQLAYHVAMGIPLWDYPVRQVVPGLADLIQSNTLVRRLNINRGKLRKDYNIYYQPLQRKSDRKPFSLKLITEEAL